MAAKRVSKLGESSSASSNSKKRPAQDLADLDSIRKASKTDATPAEIEAALALPNSTATDEELKDVMILTNRAPLLLAFAVTLLQFTMPEQPLSSRLSLAQAQVSLNSRAKAVNLGIQKGASAEDEGWGEGQPVIRVMGREVRVLRRVGYDFGEIVDDQVKVEAGQVKPENPDEGQSRCAFWGLDLEAMKKSKAETDTKRRASGSSSLLPIHTPESARSYLLKSFTAPTPDIEATTSSPSKTKNKKSSAAAATLVREESLGKVLRALELLYDSWKHRLTPEELDRRAWSWYVRVRPEVADGAAGWGQKGKVQLGNILSLRWEAATD